MIKKYCNEPVVLPERGLTQEEVEAFWSVDRGSLVMCGKKHKALADLFRDAN